MSGISAVVITRNEAGNIERCLESLTFCDEIIVVDSHSEDETRAIAGKYTNQVYTRDWKGYADQKNYAVGLCKNEWVLSVDADEQVTDELKNEILGKMESTPNNCVAYTVPRKTIHSGRWIRHGGWYPNRLIRFFKKSSGHWVGSEIHERWQPTGITEELQGHLKHYSFTSFADQVSRNNHYSTLGAELLRRQGKRASVFKMLNKPFWKFVETYFVKLGFLDGMPGFIIAISAAYSVFMKWAKLWEMDRREAQGKI
ncbi:MAG: glycosyltransferase family 2 protein [Bdellovibrionaceae bacterium]|nr:glycosyltransferase family 2 protein [Bdellovibrionales bacterium]MCB9253467.1 glycosyltransferase family 2 protein [Pseudobdellovibrionaceae bacterium]